jgi:hypothetical protein
LVQWLPFTFESTAWVNVLGKVASAALIVPTSEALGQLKWNWFHKSRAMWDFEIFDKASRGPWGAFMLLFRTRGRSLAALGALLILLLLAIDTFLQQVVVYPDRWALLGESGELPRLLNYAPPYTAEFRNHEEFGVSDKDLVPVLRDYFYWNGTQPVAYGNGTRPDIPLSCPTSRCNWSAYDTLAVCSRCADITEAVEIRYTCMNTTIDWTASWTAPDQPYPTGTVCGHFLNATATQPILLSGFVAASGSNLSISGERLLMRALPLTDFVTKEPFYGEGSVVFKNVTNALYNAIIASTTLSEVDSLKPGIPIVQECVLSWCVQKVQSAYEWGSYTETVTSEFWPTSSDTSPWPWKTYQTDDALDLTYTENITLKPPGSWLSKPVTGAEFGLNNVTVFYIKSIFDDFFPSSYSLGPGATTALLRYKQYANGPSTRSMDFNAWQAPNNVTRHVERLAASITNVMRSSSNREMIPGQAYTIRYYVLVRWEWLAFPFALLVLSLCFLISTMIKTYEDTTAGIWKTSAMPTLMYGLPEETRGRFADPTTWNSSHGDSRKVRIKLMPNLGWRVSGQDHLTTPSLSVRKNQPPPGWF